LPDRINFKAISGLVVAYFAQQLRTFINQTAPEDRAPALFMAI
jgi:hypothetical protein